MHNRWQNIFYLVNIGQEETLDWENSLVSLSGQTNEREIEESFEWFIEVQCFLRSYDCATRPPPPPLHPLPSVKCLSFPFFLCVFGQALYKSCITLWLKVLNKTKFKRFSLLLGGGGGSGGWGVGWWRRCAYGPPTCRATPVWPTVYNTVACMWPTAVPTISCDLNLVTDCIPCTKYILSLTATSCGQLLYQPYPVIMYCFDFHIMWQTAISYDFLPKSCDRLYTLYIFSPTAIAPHLSFMWPTDVHIISCD
jgi:hypothetical protein